MTSPNVDTINLNHAGTIHQFTCPENRVKEINGAYSPLNDTHYFGNVVFDMYRNWYNTVPLTFKLKMRVHYSKNYENSFWDGSQMTFWADLLGSVRGDQRDLLRHWRGKLPSST